MFSLYSFNLFYFFSVWFGLLVIVLLTDIKIRGGLDWIRSVSFSLVRSLFFCNDRVARYEIL